jgi:hypothetical protein
MWAIVIATSITSPLESAQGAWCRSHAYHGADDRALHLASGKMEVQERSSSVDLTLPRSIILTDRVNQLTRSGIIGNTWKSGLTGALSDDRKWQASAKACISARYIRMYISID